MEESGSDAGSVASFGGGPAMVLKHLKHAAALENPAPMLDKMCRSYEIVELSGADPAVLKESVAILVAGLLHKTEAIKLASFRALNLLCEAVRFNAAALLITLNFLNGTDAAESEEAAGVHCGLMVSLA
jgi:hypothetical protein